MQKLLGSLERAKLRVLFSADGKAWGLVHDYGDCVEISDAVAAEKATCEPHRLTYLIGEPHYYSSDQDVFKANYPGQRLEIYARRRSSSLVAYTIDVPYSAKFVQIRCEPGQHCNCPDCPKNNAAIVQSKLPDEGGRVRVGMPAIPSFDFLLPTVSPSRPTDPSAGGRLIVIALLTRDKSGRPLYLIVLPVLCEPKTRRGLRERHHCKLQTHVFGIKEAARVGGAATT